MTHRGLASTGPLRTDKTTLSMLVADRVDCPTHILHFADPIKDALRSIGVTKTGQPLLFRKLAQTIGQTCRNEDPNWWVNRFDALFDATPNPGPGPHLTLIDDARYQNELDWIADRQGTIVFVDAGPRINLADETRSHESEVIANILHTEFSDPRYTKPHLAREYSPYLMKDIWVARNLNCAERDLADLIVRTFNL